jgi:hypothetical protein
LKTGGTWWDLRGTWWDLVGLGGKNLKFFKFFNFEGPEGATDEDQQHPTAFYFFKKMKK